MKKTLNYIRKKISPVNERINAIDARVEGYSWKHIYYHSISTGKCLLRGGLLGLGVALASGDDINLGIFYGALLDTGQNTFRTLYYIDRILRGHPEEYEEYKRKHDNTTQT